MARGIVGFSLKHGMQPAEIYQNMKTSPRKRKSCPKTVKEAVWRMYFKSKMDGKCYVCDRSIRFTDFEVGHNKAASKGGSWNVKNLRPICRTCNRSMGTKTIETFRKKYFGDKPTRKIKKRRIQVSNLKIKRAVELFTPLYNDIEDTIKHLSSFMPSTVKEEALEKIRTDYLFLASKIKIRRKIDDFYKGIVEYNKNLKHLRSIFQDIIAREMYDFNVGIGAEAPERLDAYYDGKTVYERYLDIAARFLDVAISTSLEHKSLDTITELEHRELGKPLYLDLNAIELFYRVSDPEELNLKLDYLRNSFSISVFKKVYQIKLLTKVRNQSVALVKDAIEMRKYLSSKIQEVTLD